MLIHTKNNNTLRDLDQEKRITTVHSILILILLLQISLISLGFYLWFVYSIQQNQSFENQIIDVLDHTLTKLAAHKLRNERSAKSIENFTFNQTELMVG